MLFGGTDGGALEVRRAADGSTRLHGRFPYNSRAVLSDGGRTGRPRKETFASRAFKYRVEDPKADIHLLVGHDFGKPLASKLTGSLQFRDAAEALTFVAIISAAVAATSHGRDALAMIEAGLAVGISPGFRLPPQRAVPKAETIEQEPIDPDNDMHGATIRTVIEALLYEVSIVTAPAYDEAQVEIRSWHVPRPIVTRPLLTFARWRP